MLDKEAKYILQEQFSIDRNYQRVLNNVNKKQISYNKILKIALFSTCVAIFAAIIIPNLNNNNSDYRGIAQVNTIIERPETNTIVEIADKEIYKTIKAGGEASWAYDPTIPKNIIKDNHTSKFVVKVKVTSVGEGEILPKQENFYNPFTCHTPIKMQIEDNLLSANGLSGTITAYITGGKIKISSILETATKQEIEYIGINDISQVDKEKYIEYIWADPFYEPKIGDEYVMIIGKANENLYQICCGGYGIFKVEDDDKGNRIYKNVITGKLLEL